MSLIVSVELIQATCTEQLSTTRHNARGMQHNREVGMLSAWEFCEL